MSGVTLAHLKEEGKRPSLNERFASVDIRSEKTPEQDLRSEVGIKSMDEDFGGIMERILATSSGSTSGMLLRGEPVKGRS